MIMRLLLVIICLFCTGGYNSADETKKTPLLDGTWTVLMVEYDGNKSIAKEIKTGDVFTIKGADYRLNGATHKETGTLKSDATKSPATIDIKDSNKRTSYGIYKFEGSKLVFSLWPGQRPAKFESGPKALRVEFERK